MRLKFGPKKVSFRRLLLECGPEKWREIAALLRCLQIGDFVAPATTDRQSTQLGESFYHRRLPRSVFTNENGDGSVKLKVETPNEWQRAWKLAVLNNGIGPQIYPAKK